MSPTHTVQLYDTDAALLKSIKHFITDGDAIVIIARPHIRHTLKRAFPSQKNMVLLDAQETLSLFMEKGLPHQQKFENAVGMIMRDLSQKHINVKAFGEMVALLWEEGNSAGALMLEEMWNELQKKCAFSLHCAYPLKAINGDHQTKQVLYMCKCHTSIID
jgi:hypothetical protein